MAGVSPDLPFGLGIDQAVAGMAGLAIFFVLGSIYQALRPDAALQRRLDALAARRRELRDRSLAPRPSRMRRRPTPYGLMRKAMQRLNLLRSQAAREGQLQLLRAGFRSPDSVVPFMFFRITLPVLFGVLAAIELYGLQWIEVRPSLKLAMIAAAIIAGMFAPATYLKNRAIKRREAMQKGLPDALDLLVICAEAGLPFDAALARVARELAPSAPILADEFALTAIELTFLPDRRQALTNLEQRTDLPDLRGVIATLQQAEKYGTPLAHSLRVLAAEFRDARLIRAEEKAAKLPALLTVPMMVFIMPVLFIVLLGPAMLTVFRVLMHR